MNGEASQNKHAGRSLLVSAGRAPRLALIVRVALAVAVGVSAALACGWDGYENSVRFSFTSDRERQRLPPLPFTVGRAESAPGARREGGHDYYTPEQEGKETEDLWQHAGEAVARGDLGKARILLRDYAGHTDNTERRNSVNDQLDALAALDAGSSAANVGRYLAARRAYDTWLNATTAEPQTWPTPTGEQRAADETKAAERESGMKGWAEEVEAALAPLERDRNLADNAAYLRAAGILRAGQPGDAAQAFAALAERFPRSEKREAALYMAGRVRMEASRAYAGEGSNATSVDPCYEPECRDEAWTAARAHFAAAARQYPRGRFAGDARGWLAYLSWRVGDKAGALAEYYRMLGDENNEGAVKEALNSLRLTRGHADEADVERVQQELEDEPRAALSYAYHEIYNYTRGYYLDIPESAAENPYRGKDHDSDHYEKEWKWSEEHDGWLRERAERRELARVVRFTARMMNRYPGTAAGGAFTLRVAQASLELGDNRAALGLARRALASGVAGRERAGALWVEGVAEHRLGNLASAKAKLARLVEEFPGGDVGKGARRLLAMVAEDAGDLDAALEQYLALGYSADVAYFVDVLMTPDDLMRFVWNYQGRGKRDELFYALGVRYLRAGRYVEARDAFSRVRTKSKEAPNDYYNTYDGESGDPKGRFRYSLWEEVDGGEDASGAGVPADWVLRDLKTAHDLERLERGVALATGDEAKAEALYQLASYIFEGSCLDFYNPVAWGGSRATLISSLDEKTYRSPNEAQAVWRYSQEHEAIARALVIYLDIVKRYPNTRAARDALYTAVLAHQRLSNFNEYWRGMYGKGFHAGERLVTYADLRRAYPDYRVPRGTLGWEPSTRTVNGAPAWDAPAPKPPPPTRTEQVRRKIRRGERLALKGWELFGEVAGGRARRWSLVGLVSACLLLVFRLTRRSRAALFELLARAARRQTPTIEVLPAPASSYGAQEPYTPGARARAASRDAWRGFWQIVSDEKGRAALALNFVTHGLLTALLYALMWALRAA